MIEKNSLFYAIIITINHIIERKVAVIILVSENIYISKECFSISVT
ncbi:hypothetical protein GFV14_00545 [Candidatus Hartigia pinicola]|nr:hypothetical protein GFV14_00545 [Candidatus Hartigia pinicola]